MKTHTIAAVYLPVDPITLNKIAIIKKSIQSFGFVYLILDRAHRNPLMPNYVMNYASRSAITQNCLKRVKSDKLCIVPIDESLDKTLRDFKVDVLILNFDLEEHNGFKTLKILKTMNTPTQVFLEHEENYVDGKFIKALVDSDPTMKLFKDYCPAEAYYMFRRKMLKTIALTGKIGTDYSRGIAAMKAFGYNVIELDYLVDDLMNPKSDLFTVVKHKLKTSNGITVKTFDDLVLACKDNDPAKEVIYHEMFTRADPSVQAAMNTSFNDKIAVAFSFAVELGMEQNFKRLLYLDQSQEVLSKRLVAKGCSLDLLEKINDLHMDTSDRLEVCDIVVKPTKEGKTSAFSISKLMQTKLRKFL